MEFVVILIIVVAIFAFIMAIVQARRSSKWKREAKKTAIENKAKFYESFKHTIGLPISEGIAAVVYYCPNSLEIHSSGTQFNLEMERLTDISIKTDTEIQTQYVSSAAGAVGGAILFGAVGALIGGRVKQKKTRKIHSYLIITYSKDDSVGYMAFDVTNKILKAKKFQKEFRNTGRRKTINL